MKTTLFLKAQLVALTIFIASMSASAQKAHYASINGMKMYYIDEGKGEPIILLHGGLSTIDHDYGKMIPTLAKTHRVIGIEMQAHGHTSDIDRPLTYENMADDVLKLMASLKITRADIVGYSMGGGVALQIAISRPEVVKHLTLLSTAYSPEGMNFDNPGNLLKPKKQVDLNDSEFHKAYVKAASDTSKWKDLVKKNYGLMGGWKGFKAEDIKSLKSPVLLMFGDADISKPEHAVEMFRLLGGGIAGDVYELPNEHLCILPGTTHVQMPERANVILPLLESFLATPDTNQK